jgi:Tfp pilus assembly protein PilF
MNDDQPLDTRLRGHLLESAAADDAARTDDANAALVRRLLAEPRPVALPAGQRWRSAAAGAALALVASLGLAYMAQRPRDNAAQAAACSLPAGHLAIARGEAGQLLALGPHGELSADPDTAMHVLSSSACELRISIARGRVAVDVHALSPARLVLETPFGEVHVRGTQFGVDVNEGLLVSLLQGVIDVRTGDAQQTLVAGQTLRRSRGSAAQVAPMTGDEREQVLDVLARGGRLRTAALRSAEAPRENAPGGPVIAQQPDVVRAAPSVEPSAAARDALAQAEQARRLGRHAEARRHYERATHAVPVDAEVALLRWARFELGLGRVDAALGLLRRHRREFSRGAMGAEAAWLEVSVQRARLDSASEEAAAARLLRDFPQSPQAAALRRERGEP